MKRSLLFIIVHALRISSLISLIDNQQRAFTELLANNYGHINHHMHRLAGLTWWNVYAVYYMVLAVWFRYAAVIILQFYT